MMLLPKKIWEFKSYQCTHPESRSIRSTLRKIACRCIGCKIRKCNPGIGAVHKRCSQSGWRGLSDADVRTFWCELSKVMMCRMDKERGRLSQYGYFSDKWVNFSRFCANVFYGRPLALLIRFFLHRIFL